MSLLCFGSKEEKLPESEFDILPRKVRMRLKFSSKKEVHENGTTIRLGPRRILKSGVESSEYEALRLVDRNTSIPVPKVLGVYNTREGVLVELEVTPGKTLDAAWPSLSAQQKRKVVDDVGRFVDQLRKISPPRHELVGSATMGATFDKRFGTSGRIGPFYSLDRFHEFIRRGHAVEYFKEDDSNGGSSGGESALSITHGGRKKPYEVKFTHADLCPRNILVDDNGRVTAILSWESAGWYPEYWEYTQMHFATPEAMGDWLGMMENVMARYEAEVKAEELLRHRYAGRDYDEERSIKAPSISSSELRREQQEIDDKNTENTSG